MSSSQESGVDKPQSHCATVNNMKIMNRLNSVPATGEARTYDSLCSKPQKTLAPQTLSPAAVYELYIVLYI